MFSRNGKMCCPELGGNKYWKERQKSVSEWSGCVKGSSNYVYKMRCACFRICALKLLPLIGSNNVLTFLFLMLFSFIFNLVKLQS